MELSSDPVVLMNLMVSYVRLHWMQKLGVEASTGELTRQVHSCHWVVAPNATSEETHYV